MVSGEPYPRASDSDGSDSSGHANPPPAVRSRSLATSWRAWIVPVGACVGLALVNPVLGESSTEAGSDEFWMFLIMSVVLILISGLMSGLTVGSFGTHTAQCAPCTVPDLNLIVTGYMSLDALTMNVLATAKVPEDATKAAQVQKEKRQAAKVQTVKKHHNLLLVTLVCEQGGAATHRCTSMLCIVLTALCGTWSGTCELGCCPDAADLLRSNRAHLRCYHPFGDCDPVLWRDLPSSSVHR